MLLVTQPDTSIIPSNSYTQGTVLANEDRAINKTDIISLMEFRV